MRIKASKDKVVFNIIGFTLISVCAFLCLFPFLLMLSGSFSSNESIIKSGYSLIPREFSTEAYDFVFRFPTDVLQAYAVSIFVTVTGTVLGLFLISMAGYVLHRRDFRYRNWIAFFIYFTTIFQGGLIPWYMLIVNVLQIRDTYFVLIWNLIMSPFLIILMRSFMQSAIPHELIESAKMDGAGDFRIYARIVMPMCGPALATVGLFVALHYWNDWFSAALFIDDRQKYPLQFFLYNALTAAQYISQLAASGSINAPVETPGETAKLAMSIITIGPILFLFPFIQRFFVKGITVGAVKG